MWKKINGKLVHTTDDSRIQFRTSVSKRLLDELRLIAKENNTHVNYLIEDGLKAVVEYRHVYYDKKSRPKDRIQYKTTYDKTLLEQTRELARVNNLFINDVIEYSTKFINLNNVKKQDYRYRIE